jgi:hypothetical protein
MELVVVMRCQLKNYFQRTISDNATMTDPEQPGPPTTLAQPLSYVYFASDMLHTCDLDVELEA